MGFDLTRGLRCRGGPSRGMRSQPADPRVALQGRSFAWDAISADASSHGGPAHSAQRSTAHSEETLVATSVLSDDGSVGAEQEFRLDHEGNYVSGGRSAVGTR